MIIIGLYKISDVSSYIRKLLIKNLVPGFTASGDDIKLILPNQKNEDYKIGIWLFDIQDFSLAAGINYKIVDEHHRQYPPMPIELYYMIMINEEEQFGGSDIEEEQMILQKIFCCFHDNSFIAAEDRINFYFVKYTQEEKLRLWQTLSKPIQPALYIQAAPVLIQSEKVEEFNEVKERKTNVNNMN